MDTNKLNLKPLVITCIVLIFLLPLIGMLLANYYDIPFDKLGPYGDFIAGSTVPTVTFFSFWALLKTLKLQNEQLKVQSEELKNSIDEMKETRLEFQEQNKTMRIQRFENTFFQMVSLQNDIVDSLTYFEGITGRISFNYIINDIGQIYHQKGPGSDLENEMNIIRHAFKLSLKSNDFQVAHYCRNFYNILKFIDESDVEDKKIYIEIIKAQLSSYELSFLLYNELSTPETKFLKYIKKYNLLENLPLHILINPSHLNLLIGESNKQPVLQ